MLSSLFNLPSKKKNIITGVRSTAFACDSAYVGYKDRIVLKDINFKINEGDFIFLTGESGSGKTTFLKMLSSDLIPTQGKVAGLAYESDFFVANVFQDLRLISELTIEENLNLAYDSKLYKTKQEFFSDLFQLAKIFDFSANLSKKIIDTNRGTKQLVAIVRALLTKPNMILADEPTSSLDLALSHKLFDVLNFYNSKRKLTIVWTSHNRELVKRFNGTKVHLAGGRLQYAGKATLI